MIDKVKKVNRNFLRILFLIFIICIALILITLFIRKQHGSAQALSYRTIEHVTKVSISFITSSPVVEYSVEKDFDQVKAIVQYFTDYPRDHTEKITGSMIGNNGVVTIYGSKKPERAKIILYGNYIDERLYDENGNLVLNGTDMYYYYIGSEEPDGVSRKVKALFGLESTDN